MNALRLLVIGLLSLSSLPVSAAETLEKIVTLQGRSYSDCRISEVHPDGISFFHANGAAKVLFEDLDQGIRDRFGYSPEEAQAYYQERREKIAERKAREVEAARKLAEVQQRAIEARLVLEQRRAYYEQQTALLTSGQFFGGPVPAVGSPGNFVGPLATVYGPSFGGRQWARPRYGRGGRVWRQGFLADPWTGQGYQVSVTVDGDIFRRPVQLPEFERRRITRPGYGFVRQPWLGNDIGDGVRSTSLSESRYGYHSGYGFGYGYRPGLGYGNSGRYGVPVWTSPTLGKYVPGFFPGIGGLAAPNVGVGIRAGAVVSQPVSRGPVAPALSVGQ